MAINGDAIRSAGNTFFTVLAQLKDEKRRDARDAREEARYQDEERWRRVTMAMQEKQDARAQESHDASMKSVGLQLAEMEREAAETKAFVEANGMSPEQWGQMAEMEKFEMYKQMQTMTLKQIEANMAATRAASAYRARMEPLEMAEAQRRAEREAMDFEMDKARYDEFKRTKDFREAEATVSSIHGQLMDVNKEIEGYRDNMGELDLTKVPLPVLENQARLRKLYSEALDGKFTDELYKQLGKERGAKADAGSSEPETEAERLQRLYGAGGAAARTAESERKLLESRDAALAKEPRNSQFFYVDGQGVLQGTNDPAVISALEKTDPERILDPRLVHRGYIGKLYSPRRSSPTRGRGPAEEYMFAPEEENARTFSPQSMFGIGP